MGRGCVEGSGVFGFFGLLQEVIREAGCDLYLLVSAWVVILHYAGCCWRSLNCVALRHLLYGPIHA